MVIHQGAKLFEVGLHIAGGLCAVCMLRLVMAYEAMFAALATHIACTGVIAIPTGQSW